MARWESAVRTGHCTATSPPSTPAPVTSTRPSPLRRIPRKAPIQPWPAPPTSTWAATSPRSPTPPAAPTVPSPAWPSTTPLPDCGAGLALLTHWGEELGDVGAGGPGDRADRQLSGDPQGVPLRPSNRPADLRRTA